MAALTRYRRWGLGRAGVLAGAAILVGLAVPMAPPAAASARASRALNVRDTGRLRYIPSGSEGSVLLEEGSASGALPGRMRAHLNVGATFTGTFVLYTSHGSIRGRGSAKPSGSGRYESFHGSLTITGGTGRYVHAHGRAGLYGVFDRKTYGVTVQTTGRLSY